MWMPKPGSTSMVAPNTAPQGQSPGIAYGDPAGFRPPTALQDDFAAPQQGGGLGRGMTGRPLPGARPSNGFGGAPGTPPTTPAPPAIGSGPVDPMRALTDPTYRFTAQSTPPPAAGLGFGHAGGGGGGPAVAYGDIGTPPPPPQPSYQPPKLFNPGTPQPTPPPVTGGARPSNGMGGAPGTGPAATTPPPALPNEVNPYQQPQRPPAYNNPFGGGGFSSPFSNSAGGFGGNPYGGGGFNPYGGGGFGGNPYGGGGYNPFGGGFGPSINNFGGGFGGGGFGGGGFGGNPFGGGMMQNTGQRNQMLQNLLRMFG